MTCEEILVTQNQNASSLRTRVGRDHLSEQLGSLHHAGSAKYETFICGGGDGMLPEEHCYEFTRFHIVCMLVGNLENFLSETEHKHNIYSFINVYQGKWLDRKTCLQLAKYQTKPTFSDKPPEKIGLPIREVFHQTSINLWTDAPDAEASLENHPSSVLIVNNWPTAIDSSRISSKSKVILFQLFFSNVLIFCEATKAISSSKLSFPLFCCNIRFYFCGHDVAICGIKVSGQ